MAVATPVMVSPAFKYPAGTTTLMFKVLTVDAVTTAKLAGVDVKAILAPVGS